MAQTRIALFVKSNTPPCRRRKKIAFAFTTKILYNETRNEGDSHEDPRRRWLRLALAAVLDGRVENEREALLSIACAEDAVI